MPERALRSLGTTGLKVSRIALGTVALGLDYGAPGSAGLRPEFSDSERLLNYALDSGVNLIDTARSYGESEEIIGRAIGHRRTEFVLASKVVPSAEPQSTIRSVEQSLKVLGTETLDIVQIHCRPSDREPDSATTEALLELREQGKLQFLGASVYGSEAAAAAVQSGHFQILQIAYSALDRRPEENLLRDAGEHGIGILARSVLLKGALTERYRALPSALAEIQAAVEDLMTATATPGPRLPELAYRYVLSNPRLNCALSGATTIAELRATLQWTEFGMLPIEVLDRIRALRPLPENLLNPANWN